MRLNLQTDYALRLLSHLAVNETRLVTVAEIAGRFGISKNHLVKVSHQLVQAGYVQTVRGRFGGLRLAPRAHKKSLGDVVRLMEEDLGVVACLSSRGEPCLIDGSCRLKRVMSEATVAFLAVLDQYTLQDLVELNSPLRRLLEECA